MASTPVNPLAFLQTPSAVPKSGNGSVFAIANVASNALTGGVAGVGTFVAGKAVQLISKAAGHGDRVKRKQAEQTEASQLGLSYECIRVRDAALAAGVAFTGDSGGPHGLPGERTHDEGGEAGAAKCDAYAAQLKAAKMPTGAATVNPSPMALQNGASGPTVSVSVPQSTPQQASITGSISPMWIAIGGALSLLALVLTHGGRK
jgi:hypothetical protein